MESRMNDELLIELVREQPELYDAQSPKYSDSDSKTRIWTEIGRKIKADGGQCKARWNNIRDNFRKSLVKRRSKSGQAAKKARPYRFESQLQFLLKFMEEREAKESVGSPRPDTDEGDGDDGNEEENLEHERFEAEPPASQENLTPQFYFPELYSPSSSASVFLKPTRASGRKNTQHPEMATLMKYILEKNDGSRGPTKTLELDNPIDSFLFGISLTLKSFPPYLQNLAKSEIFSTVQKFELQMLQSIEDGSPDLQKLQNSL